MIRVADIIEKVREYPDIEEKDLEIIQRAYIYSAQVHSGQKRISGEPYLNHPLEVSYILANLRLDIPSIATGLLHDTIEDTLATREEIENRFGEEIAFLVDGTTKISLLPHVSDVEKQAESFRKLILATATDIRVVLIKLADRLHNMKTLKYLPEHRRRRIARETMEIYAPLAHRLGMNSISVELEDLAFQFSEPGEYARISKTVSSKKEEWKKYTKEIPSLLKAKMAELGISGDISWRFKHLYGIYSKMKKGNISLDNVYDILGFRIVTSNENECYQVLGVVHTLWKPIPGKIKDYIALPKLNNYQSIHTAVIGPFGEQMEIQIRTEHMHNIAEYGVAAHWKYKQGDNEQDEAEKIYTSLRQLVEFKDIKDSTEYLEAIKGELILDVIYVYTPDADLLEFPTGATPVDFAYSIHTDIGNHCARAYVNHKLVPLDYKLCTGDMVKVITSKDKVPNRQWLDFVVTAKAKNRIRSWMRQEENKKAEQMGEVITRRKFSAKGLSLQNLLKNNRISGSLEKLEFSKLSDFYRSVGFGNTAADELIQVVSPEKFAGREDKSKRIKSIMKRISKDEYKDAVLVKKYDNILINFGKCCNPVPGENVIGFITRGRGITVHIHDCPRLLEVAPERRIEVSWNEKYSGDFPISISVHCENRKGMLSDLTSTVSGQNVDIVSADIDQDETGQGNVKFEVTIKDIAQLEKLIESLRNLRGVVSVDRSIETSHSAD